MEDMMAVMLPDAVANMQLPAPELVTYYNNLERRIIWLDSEVDESWMEYIRHIVRWNIEDTGLPVEQRIPIKLFINSYGGMVDVTLSMIDAIRMSKTKVIGINMGVAYSGGAFTYLACHERLALPHSSLLLHSGSADGFSGTAQQIQEITAQYKKQVDSLKDYLINDCGLNKAMVTKKMRGEWYVDPDEAVKLGMVHRVLTNFEEIFEE